jgi:hypothetical protein
LFLDRFDVLISKIKKYHFDAILSKKKKHFEPQPQLWVSKKTEKPEQ